MTKTRIRDPQSGAILAVPVGGQAEAEFSFLNDSPDVSGFHLEAAGIGGDWVSGVNIETMVAASGLGTLTLTVSPPRSAAVGDYELRVRILCGSIPVGPEHLILLRVQPGLEAVPTPLPLMEPVPTPKAEAVKPAALSVPEIVYAPPPTQTPAPPPARPYTPSPAPPEPSPILVDMEPPAEESFEEEDESVSVQEPSLLEPPDGAVLTLRPGETLLLRFAFTNDGPRERTYILDEDRSLPTGWVTLVKDQVNLTRNGSGEVSLRLKPPPESSPGDYPFAVTVGPQGDVQTTRLLTLSVAATPSVRLVAKEEQVRISPFATAADFQLSVESVGNADTAFRIAVKAPPVKQGEETKNTRSSETAYETPQWRYLFDREADTLRSPGAGRAPRAVDVRLRLLRRGPWWFGLQETHTVSVAAVPVTDPTNGGKRENLLELTAIRRRLLPFPSVFLLLLLIPAFLLLVVKASYLGVTNAYVANSVYYVLGANATNGPMIAKLRWEAPFFAFVNVSATQNGDTEVAWFRHGQYDDKVVTPGYGLEKTYEVTRKKITVRFVPIKTDHKLQITTGDLDYRHRTDITLSPIQQGMEKVGEDGVPVQSSTYLLTVPTGKNVPLNLLNTTPRSSSANVQYWVVQRPDPAFFAVLDSKDNDQIGPTAAAAPIKLRLVNGGGNGSQELTLVTTDGGNQIVHIRLKAQ